MEIDHSKYHIIGVDLAENKDMSVHPCSCVNPNGFKFLEYGSDSQVWTHLKCGGQVVRTLIKTGRW